MNKTLKISFALKNTYRVNSILYALKQMLLIKMILPSVLYGARGLKIFANILSAIWEILSAFLGKFIYLMCIYAIVAYGYDGYSNKSELFLHMLLFLTIIGAFMNTNLFNPSKEKYYAVFLMRMDAKQYVLINYGYAILKVVIGFMPFMILVGSMLDLPLWLDVILPFSIAGLKLFVAATSLWDYEKRGLAYNENRLGKFLWAFVALMIIVACGLPAVNIAVPQIVSTALFIAFVPLGIIGAVKVIRFDEYKAVFRDLFAQTQPFADKKTQALRKQSEKYISADTSITSDRKGFEYLNELFIKRHKNILWSASKMITYVCLVLIAGAIIATYVFPEFREVTNHLILNWLPYFVFIMYIINRGTGFTQALFVNCDHSLLTYPFYKQPGMILKLFAIRLREIMKINALPALVIGAGLSLLLFITGGTDNVLNYAVIIVSILCMSAFFSVHYLTIYYLMQPYNAATEIKNGMYQVVKVATYVVCYYMIKVRMPTIVFGTLTIVFCILYCMIACILVYRFAPKTFRLRQ
ncbi:MAG TPA: hypothetical protein H9671_02755 [Firmicutes bacterium]|nr:hypothetical protein [Bacillota bacterium]